MGRKVYPRLKFLSVYQHLPSRFSAREGRVPSAARSKSQESRKDRVGQSFAAKRNE